MLPDEKQAELDLLAAHFPIIPHGLDLSLGSVEGVDDDYLAAMADLVGALDPPWWSEHIAYTRAGGVSIGHLAPLPWNRRGGRRHRPQRRASAAANPYSADPREYHGDHDRAAERDGRGRFLTAVLDRTGCGLLCDVTNLYTNAVNHGQNIDDVLDRFPWDRVVQLHFAGGHWDDGSLIDSHAHATPPEVWGVLEAAVSRAPVRGIILERDENLPPFADLIVEIEQARNIGRRHARWA